jgi:hypothetical protein
MILISKHINMPETTNTLTNFIEKLQSVQIEYLKTIGLLLPETEDLTELFLWKGLYSILAEGHYKELITTENVFKFAQIFSQFDQEKQRKYLNALEDKFIQSDRNYQNTMMISSKILTENTIQNARNKIPEAAKPIFDYILYSRLSGLEIDENLINEAIHELSPEGQAELAAANIYQTIEKTKRKPLNAGRIDGQTQYNQVFTKEQLAKVLEEKEQGSQPTNNLQASAPIAEPKIITPGIRTLPKKQPAKPAYPQQNFVSQPAQQNPTQNYPQQQVLRRSPLPRTVMNTRAAPRVSRPMNTQNRPPSPINTVPRTQPPTPGQTPEFSKTVHGLNDLLK